MPYPHAMRLHGPWEYQPLSRWRPGGDGAWREGSDRLPPPGRAKVPADWGAALGPEFRGRVRYRRGFNRPTGLDARERVWLVVEGVDARGDVVLNGQPLGEVLGYALPAEFDVTDRLLPRNELEIVVEAAPRGEYSAGGSHRAILRPGREDLPGGLVRAIRLEVRQQNFLDRLSVHTTGGEGGPRLHVAGTVAGPEVDGLKLHVTGMRRELAFVPASCGQTVAIEARAAGLPCWTPGQPCQVELIDVRLLRHGEAVWEATRAVAVAQVYWDGGRPTSVEPAEMSKPQPSAAFRRLTEIPSEDDLSGFDTEGTPVIVPVPLSWAQVVCGRLAHHPSIIAWAEPAGATALPQIDRQALADLSFGRPWVSRFP